MLILVEGRTVYLGSPSAALNHYSSLSLQCPRDESPPDFFMRCVATDAGEDEERQQARKNVEILLKSLPALEAPEIPKKFEPKSQSLKGSGAVALLTLVKREFLIRRRSKILFKAAIARTLFMAILLTWSHLAVHLDLYLIHLDPFMSKSMDPISEIRVSEGRPTYQPNISGRRGMVWIANP